MYAYYYQYVYIVPMCIDMMTAYILYSINKSGHGVFLIRNSGAHPWIGWSSKNPSCSYFFMIREYPNFCHGYEWLWNLPISHHFAIYHDFGISPCWHNPMVKHTLHTHNGFVLTWEVGTRKPPTPSSMCEIKAGLQPGIPLMASWTGPRSELHAMAWWLSDGFRGQAMAAFLVQFHYLIQRQQKHWHLWKMMKCALAYPAKWQQAQQTFFPVSLERSSNTLHRSKMV